MVFPLLDMGAEVRIADGWCKDNPQQAPVGDLRQFLGNWLARAERDRRPAAQTRRRSTPDRAPSIRSTPEPPPISALEEKAAALRARLAGRAVAESATAAPPDAQEVPDEPLQRVDRKVYFNKWAGEIRQASGPVEVLCFARLDGAMCDGVVVVRPRQRPHGFLYPDSPRCARCQREMDSRQAEQRLAEVDQQLSAARRVS